MANRDAPAGLTPAFHLTGGTIRPQKYTVADSAAFNIFTGDLVALVGTGKNIDILSSAGEAVGVVGVFAGCSYTQANGEIVYSKHWPSGTDTVGDATAYVYDDPNIVFSVQCDSGFSAGDIGQDADALHTAGSTLTGMSKYELDSSDIGTGDRLHIYDLVDRADNAVGVNAEVLVLINEHAYVNANSARFLEV